MAYSDLTLGERILLALSITPGSPDLPGGTSEANLDNALDFLIRTVPGFLEMIQDRTILDFGCGWGWQAVAMARSGAQRVVGTDIVPKWLVKARKLARANRCDARVEFLYGIHADIKERFDIVLSCSSFEHFAEPEEVLQQMRSYLRPGGRLVISFAEPWYSPYGSHMSFFTRVPWVNILFSERTVMKVRAHFRADGANRYEEIEGGLNRMSLSKFERIVSSSGMKIDWIRYYASKNLPLVSRLPVLRELLTSSAACLLREQSGD